MITDNSINEVKDKADIYTIVTKGYDVKLEKKGASYQGCCPFHNESTPSFHLSISKNIYKCFGCGVGGDPLKFIMQKDNINFIEAVIKAAGLLDIALEETEDSPEEKKIKDQRTEYLAINTSVAEKYRNYLLALDDTHPAKVEILQTRQLPLDSIIEFQMGFAPDEWKFITPGLIDKGFFYPASELGLVSTKSDSNFDAYRNRIIFPIHNHKGFVVGFGGRILGENKDQAPKYINSKESLIYKKEKVLYGLYQAISSIRKLGFAVVVEGYFDVVSMHRSGASNTVATCGTALTEEHAILLKRYTDHVVLMGDGDAAGLNSNLKSVNILVKHNLKVEICLLPKPKKAEEKIDPDIFARENQIPVESEIKIVKKAAVKKPVSKKTNG